MADLGPHLRTYIVGSTALAALITDITSPGVVEQNKIRQDIGTPRIWYQRDGWEEELDCGFYGGLRQERWSVEAISTTEAEAQNIADAIKTRLHGAHGTIGSATMQAILVDDQQDDYTPRGVGDEEGLHVSALSLTIWSS